MADIQEHDPNSPSAQDDGNGAGNGLEPARPAVKRQRAADDDDDDDEKPGRERRKIDIKFIADKSRRHITFSKRKAGIMKKAYELSVLTGTQVLLLVVSETGLVYTFTTPKLQPLVTKPEGKNLIQTCLNAPSPTSDPTNGLDDGSGGGQPVESPEESAVHPQARMSGGGMQQPARTQMQPQQQPGPYPTMSPEEHMAYQNYLQQQQQAQQHAGGYVVPPAQMPRHPGQHQ